MGRPYYWKHCDEFVLDLKICRTYGWSSICICISGVIGYDSNDYVLRRYLKRAATLDNIISAVESNSDMHREAREDWMTRLG